MRKAIVVLTILLTILAACGGSDEGWSAEAREEFVAGCESSGNTSENCTCLQEKLEAEYPDAEDPADFDEAKVVEFSKECAG